VFVYVGAYTKPKGNAEGISVYRFDPVAGNLNHIQTLGGIASPSYLASDPSGRVLFSVNEEADGAATALARDTESGTLTALNRQPTHGADPCYASLDPSARFLLIANYSGGTIAVLPISTDGRLNPASCVIQHEGSSINADRQEQAHPHMIAPSPDSRFILVTDLGMDQVRIYHLETATGTLVPNRIGPPFANAEPGAGPRHFAFAPDGRRLYILNELASSLTVFDYEPSSGTLTARQTVSSLPQDFAGENSCAHVAVASDGRFVYGSNRGHDSIAIWSVDDATGELSLAGHQQTGGRWPRNFALDPSETWLLAANERSDSIVTFRRDPASGMLTPTGQVTETASPVAILFVAG
jgi:6-phosphogluconolactonase